MSLIKICGLSTSETLDAALSAGADMVGFVRFPRSPRHVELDTAQVLSAQAKGRAARVVLLVDPSNEDVTTAIEAIAPDLIQLHGGETPARVAEIRARAGRPVMKALAIADASDLARIDLYRGAAARILLDAKPPKGAALPGGNGVAFDWTLLSDLDRTPLCVALGAGDQDANPAHRLMLSGGLTPDNVAEAIRISGLSAVDVSSGVERAPGIKDPYRIVAFIEAARAACAAQQRRVA